MSKIKYLVLDVDGTLTDGKIYMSDQGEFMKAFNIKDGYGIHDLLIPSGIVPIILTGRKSEILSNRCKEIGISQVIQGVSNKLSELCLWVSDLSSVAYIGDDLNDFDCMQAVKKAGGIVACPSDAVQKIKENADYVAVSRGGDGAVREFIDYLIGAQTNMEN